MSQDTWASGVTGPRRAGLSIINTPAEFLLGVTIDEETYPLWELVELADEGRIAESPSSLNDHCYVLDLELNKSSCRVTIDPEVGYFMRSYSVKAGTEGIERKVIDFHSPFEGFSIHSLIQTRVTDQQDVTLWLDSVIEVHSVNEVLAASLMEVEFPLWSAVL